MRFVLAAALACASLPGQQSEREAMAGRVVATDGTPVQDAEVVLLHRPIRASLAVGPEDRVAGRTGERGMFRLEVRPDTRYSAWARWPGGASGLHEGVMAGDFLVMEQDPMAAPGKVRLEGTEAWAERAPLAYRVQVGSEHIDLLSVDEADGTVAIPAMPPIEHRILEVLDRDGVVIWAAYVPADDSPFRIPGPTTARIVVRDADSGKPIAGAAIRSHIRNYWYTESTAAPPGDRFRCLWPEVAVTDAEGVAEVCIARNQGSRGTDMYFFAVADGYRCAMSGRNEGQPFRNGRKVKESPGEIEILLTGAEPVEGRVPLPDGPLPAGTVVATWRVHVRDIEGGGAMGLPFVTRPLPIRDGVFTQPAMPEGAELEHAWTVLPPGLRTRLRERFGCTLPEGHAVPRPPALLEENGAVQFDPDGLRAIEAISPHGQPAARAVALVVKVDPGTDLHGEQYIRLDRHGRALLRMQAGSQRILVLSEDGWAFVELDRQGRDVTRVQLEPTRTAAGVVMDGNGRPVPHFPIEVVVDSVGVHESPVRAAMIRRLMWTAGPLRADGKGRFRFDYVPLAFAYELRPYRFAKQRYVARHQTHFLGNDPAEPEDLEIVVDRKR